MTNPPTMRRGRPPKFVVDKSSRPIFGLSHDKANGQYFLTFWKKMGLDKRLNFGADYETAIIRFREWELNNKQKTVSLDAQSTRYEIELNGNRHPVEFCNGPMPADIETLPEITLDSPNVTIYENALRTVANVTEDLIWQKARELIAENRGKAQELLGIEFVIKSNLCYIPLNELIEKFKTQPIHVSKKSLSSRKNELREIVKTWDYFCNAIERKTVGEIEKSDIHDYYNHVMTIFYKDKYSTTWVRKKFEFIRRVFNYATKAYDNRVIDQVQKYCLSLLTPPEQVVINGPKLIKPETFKLMLSVSNPLEKAILLLSMNTAYYPQDLATVELYDIDWNDKTIIFNRKKKGHEHRAAILWPETIEALRAVVNHDGETVFYNSSRKKPYGKWFFTKIFGKVLKRAVKKVEDDKLELTIKYYTLSNCRDSVKSIGTIIPGIKQSCDAVMGHKPEGVGGAYIDPNVFPTVTEPACKAVHDYYFEQPKTPGKI